MTERKFTDEDIIKALECCTSAECDKCKWEPRGDCYRGSVECNDDLMREALDLINRQRAEIERLQKYNSDVAFKHYNDGIKEFTERLASKVNCIPQHHFTLAQVLYDIDKLVKEMAEVKEQ